MTFSDPESVAASEAAARAALEAVVDPVVRRKLLPSHPWGCKRPLFSNEFYPAFNRPNLELVTEPISHFTDDAIVTSDGTARQVDTVILATGFSATRYLSAIDVVGRDGVHIEEAWHDGATAYLGVTTAGFPNLFMLYGPNTNNGSILTMIEAQADHVVDHLRRMVDGNLAWIDVKPEAMDALQHRDTEGNRERESLAGELQWLLPFGERPGGDAVALHHGGVPPALRSG